MSIVQNPLGGNEATAVSQTDTGAVTPELAESLPYTELKRRMREEAATFENAATQETTPGGEETQRDTEADAAEETVSPERDESGRFTQRTQTPEGTRATEREYRQPETLEDALRVLDSLRGNLNNAVAERAALQKRIQDSEAEAARQRQEAEQNQFTQQHNQILAAIQRIPDPARKQQALNDYQQRIREMAAGEALQTADRQQEAIAQRAFELDKREVPGMYVDIAKFVADQHGIKPDALIAFAQSDRIANMVAAANKPEALQAVSIVLGETLDEMATLQAGREAAEKEARRKVAATTRTTRDVPAGTTPGNGNDDEVQRIQAMSPDEFAAFKRKLLAAAQ